MEKTCELAECEKPAMAGTARCTEHCLHTWQGGRCSYCNAPQHLGMELDPGQVGVKGHGLG